MPVKARFSPIFVLCSAILLASALLPLPRNGTILGLPSICPFHNLSGLPCPGCGLTRAFVCLGHGQIGAAFHWHPLGPFLFAATLFCALNSLAGQEMPRPSKRIWALIAALFVLCWGLRLGGVFAPV